MEIQYNYENSAIVLARDTEPDWARETQTETRLNWIGIEYYRPMSAIICLLPAQKVSVYSAQSLSKSLQFYQCIDCNSSIIDTAEACSILVVVL